MSILPFGKPEKRSRSWAVVREHAPVMPWEDDEELSDPVLRDTLARIAAVSGTALVLQFYLDVMELQDREQLAQGVGGALSKDEVEPIITGFYYELEELHGRPYAQRFLKIWLTCSNMVLASDRRGRVRAALKRQLARVARR